MKVYLLLDASGSMDTIWDEAVGSINGYAKGLPDNAALEVIAFSSGIPFHKLRDGVAGTWKDIRTTDLRPLGGTPLYDAFMDLAKAAEDYNDPNTVLVVMTDGQENSSRRHAATHVKDKITALEERKWPVVFLGANFDANRFYGHTMAADTRRSTRAFEVGSMKASAKSLATDTASYFSSGERSALYSG